MPSAVRAMPRTAGLRRALTHELDLNPEEVAFLMGVSPESPAVQDALRPIGVPSTTSSRREPGMDEEAPDEDGSADSDSPSPTDPSPKGAAVSRRQRRLADF
jgi:hypothetical protein